MHTFCFRKYFLVSMIASMPVLSVWAQASSLGLQALIDSSVHYLPVLLQKRALVQSAQAAVTDVRHEFLPELKFNEQVNAGTDNSLPGSFFPFGVVPATSAGIRAGQLGTTATGNLGIIYGTYDLVDFGYKQARVNRAKAYVDLEEADQQKTLYAIKWQVARLYFQLLKEQSALTADAENIERYQDIFSVIQALTLSGIRPGSDSSLAQAELSRTRISYNQTLGKIQDLKTQLAYLTGVDAGRIEVDESSLQDPKNISLPSAATQDTLEHPDIRYFERLKNISQANEKLIAKSYLPKIVLAASGWARGSSITYDDQFKSLDYGLGYQRYNYLAGLSFQYDLFNGIHRQDKLAVYRFQTAATDWQLQQEKLVIEAQKNQADNTIRTMEANLLELPIQLKAAQDTYNQKIAQYKAGVINMVDLTNAAFVLYRSINDYVETLGDWYLGKLDRASANGQLDSFIQHIK